MNRIEKNANFRRKSEILAIQIKDNYYINWKNVQIGKIVLIFPKIWTGKAVDNLRNTECRGKTDNSTTMITICLMTLALQVRVEYANIDCEMNQSKLGLSLTAV